MNTKHIKPLPLLLSWLQVNPYEPYIDYFSGDVDPTPLINAPEPKRRFIPSKWEEQK